MSHAAVSHPARPGAPAVPGATSLTVGAALAAWLALVASLGARGAFVAPPGQAPLAILAGVMTPILVFLAALRLSRAFRDYVLAADLQFMMGVQAWRFAGLGFIALYAHGVLPGLFAWPAGLGDIAIGATAPWLLVALIRRPGFAAGRTFVAWNVLGILDLVVAVGTGTLASFLASGAPGEITTGAMAQLPLVLVPAYFVPIFVMLHLAALLQARRLATRKGG
jgi:hypothetical protein